MMTDIEDSLKDRNAFHLAGIIPVAGQKLDFKFPWHDCLMPVAINLTAVEHAVLQCTYAGCETIWIVAHREMQRILRDRIGDWVLEYGSLFQASYKKKMVSDQVRRTAIYYVPIHPKDRDKRDCLAWSVIYGSLRAFHISKVISSWVVPDKYFVSFPYGLVSLDSVYQNRSLISSTKNFYMEHEGKTIRDGEYLPFTFDKEDFLKFRRVIRTGTGIHTDYTFDQATKKATFKTLPVSQAYSAKHFPLDKVFGCATLDGNNVGQTAWYSRVDSWQGYMEYMKTNSSSVFRPRFYKYHEWSPIGVDNEDLE